MSGFTEGEGCFYVVITPNNQVIASYIIELHKRDLPLLYSIQKFYGAPHPYWLRLY